MKIILLSGGSGKRLWPLSNDRRSKQFIKILRNEDVLESMVQRIWRQLKQVNLHDSTYVATGESQRAILKSQLGINDNKIITEPSRRDTFPAIALASTYLYSKVGVQDSEMIVVLPVDTYVDSSFFKKLKHLETLIDEKNGTLGLIGINPTFPSEKYGYIVPSSSNLVEKFIEKPNKQKAKSLIEQGAVWNAGVLSFKLSTMLNILREKKISLSYDMLSKNYDILPVTSFDYEFTEKQDNIVFLRYVGYWKDLGTWNTLTEEMDTRSVGYTTEMLDVSNTHVINETRLPIAVIGVEDLIVAAGPEGILISTKEDSPRVKEIPESLFKTVNLIEEDWGTQYSLFRKNKSSVECYQVLDQHSFSLDLSQDQTLLHISGLGTINKQGNSYNITGEEKLAFIVVTTEI